MRITGGKARGIPLKVPAKGEIRPATDYLREAVFSSLGPRVLEARVLDVFAGTGAYGLEALSRGAAQAHWLDKNRAAAAALEANRAAVAKSMGVSDASTLGLISQGDIFVWEPPQPGAYTLIFADPPYALWDTQADALLRRLSGWLAPEGILIAEAPGEFAPPAWAASACVKRLSKGPRQPSALFFVFRA